MRKIPLTQGKVALVDAKDFRSLNKWKWHAARISRMWYARRTVRHSDGRFEFIYMHRAILGIEKRVDHRDHNGLRNVRSNLRAASVAENGMNRRPTLGRRYKGIHFVRSHFRNKPWRAQIQKKTLGYFATAKEAARAYDSAARRLFGSFALCNFEVCHL